MNEQNRETTATAVVRSESDYTYRDTFTTPYAQHRDRTGQPFTVTDVIDTEDSSHDAEVLPMFVIRFSDGEQIEAWPEEVLTA